MDASTMVALPVNAPGVVAANVQYDLIWLARLVVVFGVSLIFFFTGLSAKFRDRVNVWTSGVYQFTVIVYAALGALALTILSLPFTYWLDFMLQPVEAHPTIPSWLFSQGLIALQATLYIIAAGLLLPFLTLVSRTRWWLIVAVFAVPVLAFNMSRAVNIPPQPGARYIEIESQAIAGLLKRCSVRNIPVFIGGAITGIDGSGADARILLATDDAANLSDAQFIAKIAQALKPDLTSDTAVAIGAASMLVSVGVYLLYVIGTAAMRRMGPRLRAKGIEDLSALPLLAGLAGFYWVFIGGPALGALQRGAALDADRFALEITQANYAVAAMHAAESSEDPSRLVDHTALHTYLRARTPSDVERIQLANSYKPWASGEALKYADICRAGPPIATPPMVKELAPDSGPDAESLPLPKQ